MKFTEKELRAIWKSANAITTTILAVESRCMAADGPVTPTTEEMTPAENDSILRHCIALTKNLVKSRKI